MYTGYIVAKTDEAGTPADKRVRVFTVDVEAETQATALVACRAIDLPLPDHYYVLQVRVEPRK